MFSEQSFSTCFPTGVWVMVVENHEKLNQQWLASIDKLQSTQSWLPNEQLTDPGFGQQAQSPANLHRSDGFQSFTQIALAGAHSVLGFLKYEYEDCYITDCWANISRPGEGHRSHIHPNNILSGVYYAKSMAGSGDIVFDDPRPQVKVLMPNPKELTPYNSHEFRVTPKPGMLVMFPSWLMHRVAVNTSDESRVSISFNIMLKGAVGFEKASAQL